MDNQSKRIPFISAFAALLAYITYFVVMNQFEELSDYSGHVYTYIPLICGKDGAGGWMVAPYCMWHLTVVGLHKLIHIPMEASAAFSSCLYALLAFYLTYWMIGRILEHYKILYSPLGLSFVSFCLSIVQPLYMYWFDASSQYLGQFSINPLHNPTHMCVKPFSLLSFCFAYDLLEFFRNREHAGIFISLEKGPKKACIALSLSLFLSCFAKPTFAEMFIPAVGIMMLGEWLVMLFQKAPDAGLYFRKCLTMLLLSVPSLLFILFQFACYFLLGGSYGDDQSSVVLTGWMEVWGRYTDNVGVSILLGMGFPLFLILINGNYFGKNRLGRLALISYGIGLLECALLGEDAKLSYGNFLWPMMSGMTLLWITATARLLVLNGAEHKTKRQQLCLHAAWFLFVLYVLFGILFLYHIIFSG